MLVDPAVSRFKFDQEVAKFRAREDDYASRGIWLLAARFPTAFAVLAARHTKPVMVPYGVLLDFRDYDLRPPSVRLTDPTTRRPYKASELGYKFLRTKITNAPAEGVPQRELQPLLVHFDEENPFICLPGIREYHNSSAHSGDSWLLHRSTGEGTLHFILENLWKYGVEPIRNPNYQIEIKFAGFNISEPPP